MIIYKTLLVPLGMQTSYLYAVCDKCQGVQGCYECNLGNGLNADNKKQRVNDGFSMITPENIIKQIVLFFRLIDNNKFYRPALYEKGKQEFILNLDFKSNRDWPVKIQLNISEIQQLSLTEMVKILQDEELEKNQILKGIAHTIFDRYEMTMENSESEEDIHEILLQSQKPCITCQQDMPLDFKLYRLVSVYNLASLHQIK